MGHSVPKLCCITTNFLYILKPIIKKLLVMIFKILTAYENMKLSILEYELGRKTGSFQRVQRYHDTLRKRNFKHLSLIRKFSFK